VVILGLIVLNIIPRSDKKEILDKSIAVLPFNNLSTDEENTYFIDGVMESILDNLCKIEDLRVPGRTSVIQYRENPKPIPIVAEEMNVAYVLEGSGQKIGKRLLLTFQLIIGNEDRHIWSKQYDRVIEKVEDLIDLQKEIAQLVAGEIEAIITQEEKELIEKIPTTDLTAYDFCQRGNEELLSGGGEESLVRAEQYYHEALQYDSTYAEAYVGLARVYWSMHYWETIFEEDFLDSTRILADKALSIDAKLSNAYTVRGYYYNQVGDLDKAIKEFERAIEINPNNSEAYKLGGELYDTNDYVKSIQYYHKALALNRGDQLPARLYNLAWV
jgi:TolB-like protein